MFICGDDEHSKREVEGILHQFGWKMVDLGNVQATRAIESLAML